MIDRESPAVRDALRRHWRSNVRLIGVLLAIWAFVGLGCGVLLAEWLNQFQLGGFPLGFWFAQQGSIATFVVLIFVYAAGLNRLDRRLRDEISRSGDA